LNDPSNNICAGVRWLFRKQAIASSLLGKNATWEEAVYEFKSLRSAKKERAEELMKRFNSLLPIAKIPKNKTRDIGFCLKIINQMAKTKN
jgi:hypothetical protein